MKSKFLSLLLIVFSAMILVGCGALLPEEPGQPGNQDAAYTQAAQTIIAEFTQNALSTAIAQATAQATAQSTSQVPQQPTSTQFIPQTGATPTATQVPPTPTATFIPPTPLPPTPTPIPCNRAEFIADVTVPDGSTFTSGAEFTKIWRIRNTGACTWNSSYSLAFVDGDRLSRRNDFPLPGNVRPGEVVDVAVDLGAPEQPGRYRGDWMLRSPEGYLFGIGAGADVSFWVSIRVIGLPPVNRSFSYDFVGDVCSANWRSSAGALPCLGGTESDDGSISFLDRPDLEDGRSENEPALWTRPESGRGGWISGVYPAYQVRPGDRFISEVGCLEGSRGCDVTFSLDYQIGNEPVRNLGTWREVYDGKITQINIDLSSLAGYNVRFILSVTNNGRAGTADAFWFVPSIRQLPVTDPGYDKIPAVAAARAYLANALGLNVNDVVVTSAEQRVWSDSCLGVRNPNTACTDVIVSGYRVVLWANGRQYEAHTNEDGSIITWFEN